MPRGQQVSRQWRILGMLERARHGKTAKELYGALGGTISERTIFRDLEQLQEAGFPIYGEGGRWRLLAGGRTRPRIALVIDVQLGTEGVHGARAGASLQSKAAAALVVLDFTAEVEHVARDLPLDAVRSLSELPGGGVQMAMRVPCLAVTASWVAGFGGAVVPRAPPELVEAVRAIHRRGLEALLRARGD